MLSSANPSTKKPQGIVIYDGPSKANNKRIVVIATGFRGSSNPKTGDMVQLWILPYDKNPMKAYQKGQDDVTCGDCKHSSVGNNGWGTCYVLIHQAPNNIWKAWKNGSYENVNSLNVHAFNNKNIRLGSYGDPAVVPIEIWESICKDAKSFTGYTHLWNKPYCDEGLKYFCMASVDTIKEKKRANATGWRTFRIRTDLETTDNEIAYPASKEMGEKTTCVKCSLCCGLEQSMSKDVTIKIHGRGYKIKRFIDIISLRKMKKGYRHLLSLPRLVKKG